MNAPVEVLPAEPESNQSPQALVRMDGAAGAVGRPLTLDQLHANLEFIRNVMRQEMREGQDYGKIPGVDRPTLLQPGAQKLLMTFNLTEEVKRETLREFPAIGPLHREYEFLVTVKAANGKTWDGAGTCSTLESKYRWRKGERKCPQCGHTTIIAENAKFLKPGQVAGWLCWKKKGGCGAKFGPKDPSITSQAAERTENENPADQWNTVRKMAFKRALVAAAINATNTSELWTQDVGDDEPAAPAEPPPAAAPSSTPGPKPAPTAAKPPAAPAKPPQATSKTRDHLIARFKGLELLLREFFTKAGCLEGQEDLKDLPLRFVPISKEEMTDLVAAVTDFGNGADAKLPYEAHYGAGFADPANPAKPPEPVTPKDDEAWRDAIVPIPPKGMKRADYIKKPETIGQLYDMRHGQDEESQAARQRLWGFVNHFEPKGWQKSDGTEMPPNDADVKFRQDLDDFAEWFEKKHPGEKL